MSSVTQTARKVSAAIKFIDEEVFSSSLARKTLVVKYGGSTMQDMTRRHDFYCQLAPLVDQGISCVLIHGGGPQITAALTEAGIETQFVDGLRITDDATMDITEKVLLDEINPRIVREINDCCREYCLVKNSKRQYQALGIDGRELLSSAPLKNGLGRVGKVIKVNNELIKQQIKKHRILVLSPIGRDSKTGLSYNINADWSAAAVAIALKAWQLLYITDELGLLDKQGKRILEITPPELTRLQNDGTISRGMIPKTQSMLVAAKKGIKNIAVISGQEPFFLLKNIGCKENLGTKLIC